MYTRKLPALAALLLLCFALAACGGDTTTPTATAITSLTNPTPAAAAPTSPATAIAIEITPGLVATPAAATTPAAGMTPATMPTSAAVMTPPTQTTDQALLQVAVEKTSKLNSYHILLNSFTRAISPTQSMTNTLEGDVDVTNKQASFNATTAGQPSIGYLQVDTMFYTRQEGGKWQKAANGPGITLLGDAFTQIGIGPNTPLTRLPDVTLDGAKYNHLQSITSIEAQGGLTITTEYLINPSDGLLKKVTAVNIQEQAGNRQEQGFEFTLSNYNQPVKIDITGLPPTPAVVPYANGPEPTAAAVSQPPQAPAPGPVLVDVDKGVATKEMKILTSKGTITLDLFPNAAPLTVANYERRANLGEYNGRTFHRVEDWVVQGNDPKGDGKGGGNITTEINKIPYTVGSLGVARSGLEFSNDSQFFITKAAQGPQADLSFLNAQIGADGKPTGGYTLFGQVTQGQDVVDAIEIGDKIYTVTVTDKK